MGINDWKPLTSKISFTNSFKAHRTILPSRRRISLAAVSSTLVRDVIRHGGDLGRLVPPTVVKALAGRGGKD